MTRRRAVKKIAHAGCPVLDPTTTPQHGRTKRAAQALGRGHRQDTGVRGVIRISPRVIQMDMTAIRTNKEVGSTKKKRAVVRAVNRGNKLGVRGGKPVKGGKG